MILKNVDKVYKIKSKEIYALNNLNLNIDEAKFGFHVIKGHSGSGKTTLIQVLGLLNDFNKGEYYLNGENIKKLSETKKAELRLNKFGFVFQSYNLIEHLTALDNIIVPSIINKKIKKKERKARAIKLLETVGLEDRKNHYPKEMSGGEQQRVAIARALINDPEIIMADEPTGNLDEKTEKVIYDLLKKISLKKCVIVVSHNPIIDNYADKIYNMKEGTLYEIK